jgi:hypothetical protein
VAHHKSVGRDRQSRRTVNRAANPTSNEKPRGQALPSSDDSDSDSDIEFKLGRSAAFIDKVQRAVSGRHGAKDSHLPKWQRLAINQIRV